MSASMLQPEILEALRRSLRATVDAGAPAGPYDRDLFVEELMGRLLQLMSNMVDGRVLPAADAQALREGLFAFARAEALPAYAATNVRAGLALLDRLKLYKLPALEDARPELAARAALLPPLPPDPLTDSTRPGERALDIALHSRYEELLRFTSLPSGEAPDPPVQVVVALRANSPAPHWLYVTYGLSELDEKVSANRAESGFGVEYTLRLVSGAEAAPTWPANLLRFLAHLVRATRVPFEPLHSTPLPPRMLDEVSPGVVDLGFISDPELGDLDTPNGHLTFVQVLPLAAGELTLVGSWDFRKYVEVLRAQAGDLLWRIDRSSVLEGPAGAAIEARVRAEGSSQQICFCPIQWSRSWLNREITLDATSRDVVVRFLRHRLAHGREAVLVDGDRKLTLVPGDAWSAHYGDKVCKVVVPAAEAGPFADALARATDGAVFAKPQKTRFRVRT
jgi:suppressor of fused